MMKTELTDFCEAYSKILTPTAAALDATLERIRVDSQEDVLRRSLAGMADVKHRFKNLLDKVSSQQAYLLIFGPLKSGKSTLMNAIAGSYVSEVTSLPAYPCLVYVRHGERAGVSIARYNGRQTAYADKKVVHALIADSHTNLADRIRAVEGQGRDFDPGVDYPEAIRRIDVQLEARSLKASGTVLVDTPGLYSRMKFGYDLMTREFRNSAACAVFVVKTDNLFLDQVFAEFNELLGLFSRVFIVVNIDSSKRDLHPDGSLQPSLESRDPAKIVEAFRSLSMSAALRNAAEMGRLRIHTVDLLNAASGFLKGNGKPPSGGVAGATEPLKVSEGSGAERPAEVGSTSNPLAGGLNGEGGSDFEGFLKDLTDYLNSSDYMVEFKQDSLRQIYTLRRELSDHCSTEALHDFRAQQERLNERRSEIIDRIGAIDSLLKTDWGAAFAPLDRAVRRVAEEESKTIRQDQTQSLLSGLDEWFGSPASLRELEKAVWNPRLEHGRHRMAESLAARLIELVDNPTGGVEISPVMAVNLDRLQLNLRAIHEAIAPVAKAQGEPASCAITLHAEEIPVKKGFWDRLFFRSQTSVRKRVFGEPEALSAEILPKKKEKRLLPEGKSTLAKMANHHLEEKYPAVPVQCADGFFQRYTGAYKKRLTDQLACVQQALAREKDELTVRINANTSISSLIEGLQRQLDAMLDEVESLNQRFISFGKSSGRESHLSAFTLWTRSFVGMDPLALGPWGEPCAEKSKTPEPSAPVRGGAFSLWTQPFVAEVPSGAGTRETVTAAPEKASEASKAVGELAVASPTGANPAEIESPGRAKPIVRIRTAEPN